MDKMIETAMELCRDPMLALESRRIVSMNAAARASFPSFREGSVPPLPDDILFSDTERFVAAAGINGRQYNVSCALSGGTRLFSLVPAEKPVNNGLLSDGMMADLLSKLFNASLAADRVAALVPKDRGDAQKFICILRHTCFSLRRQLTNLKTARELNDGNVFFIPRQTNLVTLCVELTDCVNSLIRPGKQATLSFSSPLTELTARVDPQKLERIILNLLSNSFAHTPPDGSIRLRLNRSGASAVLSVDDDGEGIPPDILRNIFARYEARLDGDTLDKGITGGLGLGIAAGLTRLHGGTLLIESRERQGTSVRATLPLNNPSIVELRSRDDPDTVGMSGILTELSDLLGPECYSTKYLD